MYYGELTLDDLDRWWDTIDVNLSAPFRLARAASPALKASQGQVINMSSVSGVAAGAGYSAYCASKAGLIGLTKALALELAPDVRVNAVAPGHVDTPQQRVDAEAAGLTRDELYAHYAKIIPIGRILHPAEVARLVTYLASETGYTGSTVHLNGGLLLV
jgi:NAD(P)-dependent dehydrogenase (short-subunit alcohol dehydrogenase family)